MLQVAENIYFLCISCSVRWGEPCLSSDYHCAKVKKEVAVLVAACNVSGPLMQWVGNSAKIYKNTKILWVLLFNPLGSYLKKVT